MRHFIPPYHAKKITLLWSVLAWLCIASGLFTCSRKSPPPYQDLSHPSAVFNKQKQYRLYLPDQYPVTQTRYPVIYFFHGWGGRHFKDDNAKLEYVKIKELVDKYQVILVMWDGNITEDQPRPYNIGNHENITSNVQMADYFIELMNHIDSTCRTLAEREHRGIIGFSMGGFLSYFISGKHPDLVSAAVNMTGSPEFFVGHPKNHTLFPLRYTFKNLKEVNLRFHNSTADELTDLNKEVHQGALWEGGLSYDYWVFEGGHKVDDPGKTEVFEKAMNFIVNSFDHPRPRPGKWWHYDIYPEFSIWGYQIKTNKKVPGFIYLKGVSNHGFGLSTHKWLPDGPELDGVEMEVITAPIYNPRTEYLTVHYLKEEKRIINAALASDTLGRLHFHSGLTGYEVGIFKVNDPPDLIPVGYSLDMNNRYLRTQKENKLSVHLFNRGGELVKRKNSKISITPMDSQVEIEPDTMVVALDPGKRLFESPLFKILISKKPPHSAAPAEVKLKVMISVDTLQYEDEIIVPVYYEAPKFETFILDDGRNVNDSVSVYGHGNGDGIAAAGEQVMVYVDGHRTRLYTDDPYVETNKEILVDEALPAKWPDGFTLSSVISINPSCPKGHRIACLVNYETKEYMPINRKLTWGRIWIETKK